MVRTKNIGLGEDFLVELENAYNKIVKNPTFYSYFDDKKVLRDIHSNRFPFLIVYRIKENTIEIISIHQTKKHPFKRYGITIVCIISLPELENHE
jgi:hypothetical protein